MAIVYLLLSEVNKVCSVYRSIHTVTYGCLGPRVVVGARDCSIASHVGVSVATSVGGSGVDKREIAVPGFYPCIKHERRGSTSGAPRVNCKVNIVYRNAGSCGFVLFPFSYILSTSLFLNQVLVKTSGIF